MVQNHGLKERRDDKFESESQVNAHRELMDRIATDYATYVLNEATHI